MIHPRPRLSQPRALRALLLISCLAMTACATVRPPQGLRLMSYNVAAGRGDLGRIADVIRMERPDIVALQEVDVHWSDRSGFADQAAALGEMLGMEVRFGPIYTLPGAGSAPRREYGLAILSRYPIAEFRNHVIPRLSTQTSETEPVPLPGFLEAVMDIHGVRVHVFNTHLDYRADPRVRVQQTAAMLDLMPEADTAVILMGDLNAQPDARELEPLFQRLHDAWRGDQARGFTYPAAVPERRIDYVLLSSAFSIVDSRVPVTEASDHRPVVADVLLK